MVAGINPLIAVLTGVGNWPVTGVGLAELTLP